MATRSLRAVVTALLACACFVAASCGAAAFTQTTDPDALRIFTERVDRYATLRDRLEEPLPPFDARRDSWSLLLTRRYLASAIRTARSRAQLGDIFGPPVGEMFHATIADAIDQVDIEGLVEDEAEVLVDLVVNEPFQPWALRAVPAVLLERLPPLPPAIEYRIVSGALVIWDVHAEILIDALPHAFSG